MTRTNSPPLPPLTFCRMSFETFRSSCAPLLAWAWVLCSKTKRGENRSETKPPHSIGKIKRFIQLLRETREKFHSRLKKSIRERRRKSWGNSTHPSGTHAGGGAV